MKFTGCYKVNCSLFLPCFILLSVLLCDTHILVDDTTTLELQQNLNPSLDEVFGKRTRVVLSEICQFYSRKTTAKTYATCEVDLVNSLDNNNMPQKHQQHSKSFHCSSSVDNNFTLTYLKSMFLLYEHESTVLQYESIPCFYTSRDLAINSLIWYMIINCFC